MPFLHVCLLTLTLDLCHFQEFQFCFQDAFTARFLDRPGNLLVPAAHWHCSVWFRPGVAWVEQTGGVWFLTARIWFSFLSASDGVMLGKNLCLYRAVFFHSPYLTELMQCRSAVLFIMTKTTANMTSPADSRAIMIGYQKASVQIAKNS